MADAQRGGAGRIAGTSIGDRRASLPRTGSSTALMASHRRRQDGSDRIPGPVGGHQDRHLLMDRPRFIALPPRLRLSSADRQGLALFRPLPDPRALVAEQHEGFFRLDDAGQGRIGGFGVKKAMAPPESGADRHATAFGRGDNRIALAQRPAELEPALLLPQPGQRVPVSALKLLPHFLQRNRRTPFAAPQPTDAPSPQCGTGAHRPGSPRLPPLPPRAAFAPPHLLKVKALSAVRSSTSQATPESPGSIKTSIRTRLIYRAIPSYAVAL